MATANWTARLKLTDDDPKSLGVSNILTVSCVEGLTEGVDFAVDREAGTVRRLREFGRELYTFAITYDDLSEQRAAEEARAAYEAEQRADVQLRFAAHALKGKTPAEIYTLVQARIDGWSNLTQAKVDFRDWMPLLFAAVAWMVMEREG